MRKSSDRHAIIFGATLVAVTFLLVLDVQSGLNLRGNYLPIPEPKTQLDLSEHAQELGGESSEQVSDEHERIQSNGFIGLKQHLEHHLQQIGKLRKYLGSRSSSQVDEFANTFFSSKDYYTDLKDAVNYVEVSDSGAHHTAPQPTLAFLLSATPNASWTILDKFNYEIKQNELYAPDSETIDLLIQEMATADIASVEEKEGGTQIKFQLEFDNSMLAIAKPMRFPREQQTFENYMLYADYERHTAEIAAFHLDRLLGFRRAFPVTGRTLNVTSQLYELCDEELKKTFFTSLQPYKNLCLTGNCKRYCDMEHPTCGQNGLIEVSIIAFFPVYLGVKMKSVVHPWRKSYSPFQKAIWERDSGYCQKVKSVPPFNKGRRIFDIVDMGIFDFLTGNLDRHNYGTFTLFGGDTFTIHYDNGRGFGRPYYDELTNLAPLKQCCMIRSSTLRTLLRFHNGPKPLSQLMRESMASDPVAPVLWEPHLTALDRRVNIILTAVRDCIQANPIQAVVYPRDEF